MKNIISSIVAALLVSVVVCALFVHGSVPTAGGSFNVVRQEFDGGIKVGVDGSTVVKGGTTGVCTTGGSTSTINALGSVEATCTVTGVLSGDKVIIGTNPLTAKYIQIATSTVSANNTIRVSFFNALATSNVSLTGATGSLPYFIIR